MKEEWKDIPDFEGYQISNFGRVRSTGSKARILRQVKNKNWDYLYITIGLLRNQKKTLRVHRLVAKAFIPNPDNLLQVNHKDFNGLNNHVDNLEWVTPSQNMKHSYTNGHREKAPRNVKVTTDDIFEIRCLKYYGATVSNIAKEYCLDKSSIYNILKGKTWANV